MQPLHLLWYVFDILLDRFINQRVMPIIRAGKLELLAEVMGGVLPAILQALIRAGPIIMDILLNV